MQVKAISAPIEALVSNYGRAGFFLADSDEVASCTHDVDVVRNRHVPAEPSAWVAIPFGRDVLAAAAMVDIGICAGDLAALDDDQVREWMLGCLLFAGVSAAKRELHTPRFAAGYVDDPEEAEFFAVALARIDASFGFGADPQPEPARTRRTRPAAPAVVAIPV